MNIPPLRMNTRQAAEYIGLAARTLESLRVKGGGPSYFKLGSRCIYSRDALDEWLADKLRQSTSDKGESKAA